MKDMLRFTIFEPRSSGSRASNPVLNKQIRTDRRSVAITPAAGSGRSYRIGFLGTPASVGSALTSLQSAAGRLNHEVVFATDLAELDTAVDFVLAPATTCPRPSNVPTFGIVHEVKAGFQGDDERLRDLLEYDGYLTISNSVLQFLSAACLADRAEPCIGFFELTPEREFVTCQIEKLIDSESLRLCHIDGSGQFKAPPLVEALADRPYLRLYRPEGSGAAQREAGAGHVPLRANPLRGQSPQRIFAAFGAGIVILSDQHDMDAAALYRLCEIVSVGAVAICPDIPWIRRHFGESVAYYPRDEPISAALAVDCAVEEIGSDARRADARARVARAIFEKTLAAEIMLRNAVGVFEKWQARASQERAPLSGRTVVETDRGAIANVFARMSQQNLLGVAQAVAALKPLEPVPHWRFGSFTESPDLAVHVRYSLWLAGVARGGTAPIVVPWHAATRLRLYLDNDLSLTLFAGGAFEPNEFALLNRVLQPGMVFLDGGANEGVYTVFAAARVGATGRVIAVEPSSRELKRLKGNIALNQLRNVDIVAAALAEVSGSAPLLIAEKLHAGQNTLGAFAYDTVKSVGAQDVAVKTVDEIALQYGLSRLDILKLDLEGAEIRALSGAMRVLAEMRPLVLTEVSEAALVHQAGSARALFDLLEAADYVLLTIDDETGEPIPLRSAKRPPSDNIVAVHVERDWGLLTG